MSIIVTDITTAYAMPEPKHTVLDGDVATVYTGDDIPVATPVRNIRDWAFRKRFTDEEQDAINNLAFSQLDTLGQRLLMAIYTASDGVDLDGQDVNNGLNYWVFKGILTPERKLEILA
jgi:hypothetical protein